MEFTVGERVAALRKRKDMTQYDLAKAAGLTESMISRIELGLSKPGEDKLGKIAEALGCVLSVAFESNE